MNRVPSFNEWLMLEDAERWRLHGEWNAYAGEGEQLVLNIKDHLQREYASQLQSAVETRHGVYHGGIWMITVIYHDAPVPELPETYLGVMLQTVTHVVRTLRVNHQVGFPLNSNTHCKAAFRVLLEKGYHVSIIRYPLATGYSEYGFQARRDGFELWAETPMELLGAVSLYEHIGPPPAPTEPWWDIDDSDLSYEVITRGGTFLAPKP